MTQTFPNNFVSVQAQILEIRGQGELKRYLPILLLFNHTAVLYSTV